MTREKHTVSRRHVLGAAATGAAGSVLAPGLARAASVTAPAGATLDDIEHIVVLMQENRSFDEYFGTMSGVIGFDDPNALPGVFQQRGSTDTTTLTGNMPGVLLPWHLDTSTTDAQSASGLLHDWPNQHAAWAEGQMDAFLPAQAGEPITMGYFTRADIPYHFALADNFTVLDRYHCSLLGPTWPNRLYLMSGTNDPNGTNGGPVIENTPQAGMLTWESFAETLQNAGIDWYLYQESDNYGDNMLPLFKSFQDTTTDLYRRGNSVIPSTSLLGQGLANRLKSDVLTGKLPQVSYIVGPQETTEHPTASPGRGAQFIDQVLQALTADLDVWAKTLLILNYDENDGHFDHVVPPTPPLGTENEYVAGLPVGLGFRVPCILISPFTVGPLVCSDVFDHTSVIQLIERRFGVRCPNISDWRRATVGDLTSAINFAATPSTALPVLPNGDAQAAAVTAEKSLPTPEPPAQQAMPHQETAPVRARPSGLVAGTPPPALPEAPLPIALPAVAAVAGVGAVIARRRKLGV